MFKINVVFDFGINKLGGWVVLAEYKEWPGRDIQFQHESEPKPKNKP